MKTEKIYKLHVEHYHWLENLRFYEDEINYLRKKTGELMVKNTSGEVRNEVKDLQEKIIHYKSEVEELKRVIKDHEAYLNNLKDLSGDKLNRHLTERNRMEQFEKIFSDLKFRCMNFFAGTD